MIEATDKTRVLDLCCGMGGLSVAAREMGMRVVAGVDVNPSALRTSSRNFPEAEAIEGSVRSRRVLERCRALLDGDGHSLSIVLSGPPCQGFSAAGSRDPKDRRNGVLVAAARAIAKSQPDCAVIEKVSTVLAEMHGERLESFRQVLSGAGCHVEKKVLNSSENEGGGHISSFYHLRASGRGAAAMTMVRLLPTVLPPRARNTPHVAASRLPSTRAPTRGRNSK